MSLGTSPQAIVGRVEMFLLYMCLIFYNLYHRKLLLPTSSEEFKILEEGPLRVSVEVSVGTTVEGSQVLPSISLQEKFLQFRASE